MNGNIIVLHIKAWEKKPVEGYSAVQIDRQTTLGNPERMKNKSDQERHRVIKVCRIEIDKSRRANGPMWQAIEELANRVEDGENLALLCWCAPKPCHGDIIKNAIHYIIRERHPTLADPEQSFEGP